MKWILFMLLLVSVSTEAQIITTFAGDSSLHGYSGDGGPATAAELKYPTGVSFDNSGNLYIADYNNYRVRMVSTSALLALLKANGIRGESGENVPATAAE